MIVVEMAAEARRVAAEFGFVVPKPLAGMGKENLMASHDGLSWLTILLVLMSILIIIVVSILVLRLMEELPVGLCRVRTGHVAHWVFKLCRPVMLHF